MNKQPLTEITHNIKISEKLIDHSKLDQSFAQKIYKNPVLIDDQYLENSNRLAHILNSVLVMFAYNYSRDARLQKTYQLDNDLNEILMMAEGTPYEIGMYRPHFWYDENGQAKIGELNTRNALHNYLKSCQLKKIVSDSESPVSCLQEFADRYDSEDTLYMIQDHKDESVIEALEKLNLKVKSVQPNDFVLNDGKLMVNGELARQFYLDVDRETLKTFDKGVLKTIITSGRCINDVRSLILIQDRRTLVTLFNTQVMNSYINEEDYKFLQTFLAPCFTIQTKDDQQLLLTSEQNWTLKLNNARGEKDIINKIDTDSEEWQDLINNQWHLHIVQPHINKKTFNLTKNDSELTAEIEGFDVFFNGKSYGPGLFHSTVKRGETIYLIPSIEKTV